MTPRGIKLLLLLFITLLPTTRAIVTPAAEVAEDRGAAGLSQALKRLDVVASVLHTGAHPDDENSALLAWLSRGQGARTAYLSLTRGEGGVNLVGTELFEALGVIRTEELLAARRLDGAQQFFTPNYEFGFSKSAEDGFGKWGHDQVLGDVVRVIRQFRPEIIISRFTGTPRDGHGHHQIAGIVTQEAFKAAADPKLFPEYGKPWQAKKLYLNSMGQCQRTRWALRSMSVSSIRRMGRSYNEIASEGRSMHRSQAQGGAQERGPRATRVQLVQKTVRRFDNAPVVRRSHLQAAGSRAARRQRLHPMLLDLEQHDRCDPPKGESVRASRHCSRSCSRFEAASAHPEQNQETNRCSFLLQQKERDFQEALRLAAGLVVDVVVSDDTVVPGQEFDLTVSVSQWWSIRLSPAFASKTDLPPGWDGDSAGFDWQPSVRPAAGSEIQSESCRRTPISLSPTGCASHAAATASSGRRLLDGKVPEDESLLPTRVEVDYEGTVIATREIGPIPPHRSHAWRAAHGTESSAGVIASTSVPDIAIVPMKGNRQKELTVTVENQNPTPLNGRRDASAAVRLDRCSGIAAVQANATGEKESLSFMVSVPPVAGDFVVQAVARVGNQEVKNGYTLIAYPHIESRYVYSPAAIESRSTGSGDDDHIGRLRRRNRGRHSRCAAAAGNRCDRAVAARTSQRSDLSRFRAIVLGVRAYAVRDDLRAYNKRLLEYVSNGGTLVVQYNRGNELGNLQIGPYPFTAPNVNENNTERVTKEDAPVKLLNPDHALLSVPNKITEEDFDGWIDERGTFFLAEMGSEVHGASGEPRSGRGSPAGRPGGGEIRQGYLHLCRLFIFPTIARRGKRGLQAFCQSCKRGELVASLEDECSR